MNKTSKALFVTTKNVDYIRNTQEIQLLKECTNELNIVYSNKKNYIGRMIEIYWYLLSHSLKKYDTFFIGFSPQLILPFFKWKMKGKITIDFFISVYDTFVNDRKKFGEKSVFSFIFLWLDKMTIKYADEVVVDTKAHGQYFIREFALKPEKMKVLYLQADETIYYPRVQNKEENLQDKFVVLYFGSILPLQGVDVILRAVEFLKEDDDICFEIIGPVTQEKPERENVKYFDWLSQEDLANHVANADLCLAGHFNSTIGKAKRTIPGKAYIYESMGKKMILGDNEATHELFVEDEKHKFVEMGNAEVLVETIVRCKNEWESARGEADE